MRGLFTWFGALPTWWGWGHQGISDLEAGAPRVVQVW